MLAALRFYCLMIVLTTPVMTAIAATVDCGTIIIPPGIGIGPGSDVTSFNPLLVDSLYNSEASDLLFEQLIWVNEFHVIDYTRSVASAVSSPDNGMTYDITLRAWHWSDGVAVTARDVAYTYHLIQQLGSTYPGYGQGGMPDLIRSLTVTDATHLTITLTHQVNPNWFILNGLSQLLPLPQHIWGRYTLDQIWQNQSSPAFFQVIDGPLMLQHYAVGLDAVFVPNPAYDGPKMRFSRLIMKFINSEGQELQEVESHGLDVSNLPFALWNAAQHLPGVHIVTLPASYSWHELMPNLANAGTGFFKDVRVRQAIADAINQPEMIGLAMHGNGLPNYGPVPAQPASFLSPAARAGQFPVGYNPAKARALLGQAGFAPGPDGIMQKQGVRLSFTVLVPAGETMRIEMAESMQENLRAVGIEMKVHQVEFNQMMALMVGPPAGWQALFMAMNLVGYPSGESLFTAGGFYNNGHYVSAEMDRLVADSTDRPGMAGLFAYEDYASAQQPVIFLPVEKYSLLVRNGLHGVEDFANPANPAGIWSPDRLYCTNDAP